MYEVQRLAAMLIGRVVSGRSLDVELRAAHASHPGLTSQERAALQDIAYGTLRWLGQIDAVLRELLDRPLAHDRVRHLLRVALYQLLHTRAAPHAVVDHAVRVCTSIGQRAAKGLVNAVLRAFLRNRERVLVSASSSELGRYSYPQWWIDKVRVQYPNHFDSILVNGNAHPPLTLRVNSRQTTAEAYLARLRTEGMAAHGLGGAAVVLERPVPVDRIPGFRDGVVSVQDASAQEAAFLLDLARGTRVLDACAAPGGKTAHMLELVDAEVLALDNDESRLERIRANLARLHLNADVRSGDAANPATWWDGRRFDRILADVPCSASGVVRRHPDIKWLRRPDDIARFAARQGEILGALWQLLASDGKLLYSTCSVFHEENGEQITRFLERHRDARRASLPELQTNAQQLSGQILPDQNHDGFFYALLQKS